MYNPNTFFLSPRGYNIEKSLRFNSNDSAHLTRTPSSASNRRTFTWSAWIKIDASTDNQNLFSATPSGDGTLQDDIMLSSNSLSVYGIDTYIVYSKTLTRKFRDPSAWYHLVVAFNTTDSTAEDRIKIYVNGERQTDFSTNTNSSANFTTGFNNTEEHSIGARTGYSGSQNFNGYQAEINFIDGSQLGPESFGQFDPATGAWTPKRYSGSYGTNGFYLNFADNSNTTASTLGKDSSGNGNNWTPNNFSVSSGVGDDSMDDTPTNNWATLDNIHYRGGNSTFSNGNLQVQLPAANSTGRASGNHVVYSGKWYWEVVYTASYGDYLYVGVSGNDGNSYSRMVRGSDGELLPNTGTVSVSYTTNDIIMVALDVDNGKWYIGKNGSWMLSGDPAGGTGFVHSGLVTTNNGLMPHFQNATGNGTQTINLNFGQRGFSYTPPTGFKALNTKNLPVPTVLNGKSHFNPVLYTGNSGTQTITGVGFQPEWIMTKSRNDTEVTASYDIVRTPPNVLYTFDTNSQENNSGYLNAFTSDGFTVGAADLSNESGSTFVAWCWKLGGSASNNTSGTITGSVSANTSSGVSVVKYTGTGSNATVGHGLGVAPSMVVIKGLDNEDHWFVYNSNLDNPTTEYIYWNLNNDASSGANAWNSTNPTSTVFSIGTDGGVNGSGNDYIAYCFAEVSGFSKFGKYIGTDSNDGAQVFCGFRPAYLVIKKISSNDAWFVSDSTRSPGNEIDEFLKLDTNDQESNMNITNGIDFLASGFKIRDNDGGVNDGGTFIFWAFAETPFKYANAR
tara:strand:- start:476 stop:2836 length:2361 start_codon:yes stop_codon:yes gene_type:complete